jgi:hypothetical protein
MAEIPSPLRLRIYSRWRQQPADLESVDAFRRALELALDDLGMVVGYPTSVLEDAEYAPEGRVLLQLSPEAPDEEVAAIPLDGDAMRHREDLIQAGYYVQFRKVWRGPWQPDDIDYEAEAAQ